MRAGHDPLPEEACALCGWVTRFLHTYIRACFIEHLPQSSACTEAHAKHRGIYCKHTCAHKFIQHTAQIHLDCTAISKGYILPCTAHKLHANNFDTYSEQYYKIDL